MTQTIIAPSVRITTLDASKFKRYRISVNFVCKNNRKTATAMALLPYLMERGYADCPDMTELSKLLAKLYSADLRVSSMTSGANRVLSVSISGLKNEYALQNEDLATEYIKLCLGVAFKPYFVDGKFDREAIDIEKEKLREALESEINEKRSYCIRQARRKFFGDAPEGIEANGYLDEIDGLTAQSVTQAYLEMLETAQIEMLNFGLDENLAQSQMKIHLKTINRKPQQPYEASAQPIVEKQRFTQEVDAVQGKLCLLFTSGRVISNDEHTKFKTAIALLGTTPTSRLFTNVREKQSLCYYCAAGFAPITGVLCIDSGIEHENAALTRDAILKEIEDLKTNNVTQKELNDTKRCLINSLNGIEDTLAGLESWYFGEIIKKGTFNKPQDIKKQIEDVSMQDIKDVLSCFTLSVEYVLVQKTEGGNANG